MLQELYEQYKDTFSKSDHKLIQYLLRNEEQLQYLTSEELSAHTGISPATVSRFWKKIGFQNLKELKIKQRIQDTATPSSSFMGNPNRFSIGFRVLPRWYAMVGASPYSSVGYVIQTEEEVEGMPGSYTYSLFEGSGGLYRCYLTNAFALTKNLSVGVNLGIILGTVTQSETQESAIVEYESSKRAFYADFGVHYEFNTTRRQKWAAGLVFAPSLQISHDNNLTYSNSSTSDNLDKSYHSRTQYLPMHIGSGVSMTTERWVVTADYNYLDWSRNTSSYTSMKYENQHKMNIGGIYTTNPRYPRSTELMGGVGFSNSYINLRGGKMKYLEISAGASFPIRYSYLSLGATWRKQINSRSSLMQESRFSVNLNLTFGERISRAKLK